MSPRGAKGPKGGLGRIFAVYLCYTAYRGSGIRKSACAFSCQNFQNCLQKNHNKVGVLNQDFRVETHCLASPVSDAFCGFVLYRVGVSQHCGILNKR